MDDTVAMQDTNPRGEDAACASTACDQLVALKGASTAFSEPVSPQQAIDAASMASDSSGQEQTAKQHSVSFRIGQSGVDADVAKQAAMSALAGLDLTTTKANLDASKAAAATARANGDVPSHVRKSSLRSVSCRQLGSSTNSSSTPTASKTVGFDEASKNRSVVDGNKPAASQWRGGVSDGQSRRLTRGPASRCVSLPHVLQGRAGMTSRLAATYAQDAALQQQLQLLGHGVPQQLAAISQLQHPGMQHRDTLSMFQLQQAQHLQQAANTPAAALAQPRTFVPGMVSLDDSVLPVQSGNLVLHQAQQPLQQLQPQQARLAPAWQTASAAAQPQLARWGSGQMAQQAVAQGANTNAQLLAQLQATSQSQSANDALWMTPASAALQLPNSRSQGVLLQQSTVSGGMTGVPGMAQQPQQQQQQQLLAAQFQPTATPGLPGIAGTGSSVQAPGVPASGNALLEQYQVVSWNVLALAQGESALHDQLLTELVLLLTLLHTLNNASKGSMTTVDAINDFNYLATAARRHMATYSRLSQAGNIAVQLLAMTTPMVLWQYSGSELLEAAFLVLDTLALANRDVATVVSQQRIAVIASSCVQLPIEQRLQQQTLGLQWIAGLASAVNRNKAVLESMTSDSSQSTAAGLTASAVTQPTGLSATGMLSGGGMPVNSSPPMLLPTGTLSSNALSPNTKTPLATFFEETSLGGNVSGVGPASSMPAPAAVAGTMTVGQGLTEQLLAANGLSGVQLNRPSVVDGNAATGATGLGYSSLDKLGGLPSAAAPAAGTQSAGAATPGTYSPLGSGLSLFGDGSVINHSSSGPNSAGISHILGV